MSNIIIALQKIEDAKRLQAVLERNGLSVTSVCNTAAKALSLVSVLEEGVIICGYRLPDMGFLELQECLNEEFEVLVLTSPKYAQEVSGAAVCITLPVRQSELIHTVNMMLDQIAERRRKLKKPRARSREEKSCITDAKLRLMKMKQFTEEEAYRYLQKRSMNTGTTMAEAAKRMLEELAETSKETGKQ